MTNTEHAEKILEERHYTDQLRHEGAVGYFDVKAAVKALNNSGLITPDLPEPYSQDESSTSWLLNGDVGVKVNPRCAVIIEHMDVGWFALPPEDASRFADMIKAAANHAEQENPNA